MATADTARLIASLELQDKFSKTADKALTKVDRIDKRLGAFSGAVNRNLARGVDAVISKGVRALTSSVTEGLSSLAELEDATTKVDGAAEKWGDNAKVTGAQVAKWANTIETNVQAAFDDKAITGATANLIRFGKVTPSNIRPAMQVMTDLAAKTGDVDSASTLLGKALADPAKAAGKLARVGIVLTKAQQKQVAAFDKAGEKAKAQRYLLEILADTTEGAAAGSAGKYRDTLNLLADASEDAKKALAEGFFPVVQRVAAKITELANDPATLDRLRAFGDTLASAFDKAVDIAEDIDWKAMGDGLKAAAGWAQKVWDAFNAAPAEAKGMILALAGLTKLTGGAPIKIAVDFAKDALGGIFGHFFERGSSPANPMFVSSGLPGAPAAGGPGAAAGGGSLLGFLGVAALPVAIASVAGVAAQSLTDGLASLISGGDKNRETFWQRGFDQITTALNPIGGFVADLGTNIENLSHLDRIPGEIGKIVDWVTGHDPLPGAGKTNLAGGRGGPGGGKGTQAVVENTKGTKDAVLQSQGVLDQSILDTRDAVHRTKEAVSNSVAMAGTLTSSASRQAGNQVAINASGNTDRVLAGLRGLPVPSVTTIVNVSGNTVTSSQTTVSRSSQMSSRSDDNFNDHR